MHNITIRPVCEKDYDFVLKTNLENVAVLSPMDKERMLKFEAMSELFLLAEVDGQPAAFMLAFREGASGYDSENYRWFSSRYDKFLYIDRIAIIEPYRRQGIGKKIYEAIFDHARKINAPVVLLEIDTIPYNEASLNFHKSLGFHEVGTQYVKFNDVTVSLQEAPVNI